MNFFELAHEVIDLEKKYDNEVKQKHIDSYTIEILRSGLVVVDVCFKPTRVAINFIDLGKRNFHYVGRWHDKVR